MEKQRDCAGLSAAEKMAKLDEKTERHREQEKKFSGRELSPEEARESFFENVVKIFVLTNAALPADLGDGQFSLPDEFQSVLNTAAVEVVNDRCAKLFLKLLVDVPFRVVELFLKVSKCYLALVILFQIGYDA